MLTCKLDFIHSSRNILIKNNQLKVTDFGISRVMTNPKTKVTAFVGKQVYMAPEQIKGEEYGLKCDVWCVLI